MRRPAAGALVWAAAALAAVSAGIAAGPLPWLLAGESGLPASEAPPAAAAGPAAISIEPILALSPFGRIAAPAEETAPATETALGLTLHGVVIAVDPARSTAIVSGEDDPAAVYLVGDAIGGAAVLEAVAADHVTLRVDGRPETLSFPQNDGAATTGGDRAGGDSGVAALRALVTGGDRPAAPAAGAPVDPATVIERYRARIRDNPQTVLDGLGVTATPEGYRVGPAAAGPVTRAGLRPGDVVARVNGQQVGNIEDDRRFFDDVAASGRARIEVMRDGQRIVLSFPLR